MDHRVRSYAAEVVADCSPDRITAVSRFEAGERHAVYKVSYVDPGGRTNDFVVRIASSDEARDCVQAEREAAVLTKVQGVAGPLLYDFRCESQWFDAPTTCMQFVPGEQGELAAAAPADVQRLGSVVAQVHALPIDDLGEWFPTTTTHAEYIDGRVEVIVGKLRSVRDPLAASVQRRLHDALLLVTSSVDRVRTANRSGTDDRLVLQHGDIASGNVVWGSTPVLIDWEYARLGDPADEIAYIFGQNDLSAPQRKAFWSGYRTTASHDPQLEDVADRIRWWEPVNLLGSALWWIERWAECSDADGAGEVNASVPSAQDYYREHALRRLDRFERIADAGPLGS